MAFKHNTKLRYCYERTEYGKTTIDKRYLDGKTIDEYVEIFDNSCIFGVVYILHKHSNMNKEFQKITMNQIGKEIGWKRRSVMRAFKSLENSILRTSIKKIKLNIKTTDGSSSLYYLDNHAFSELTYNELKCLVNLSYYTRDPKIPWYPELCILQLCQEMYPHGEFVYNGNRCSENRRGNIYPDIISEKYKIVIEHYGSRYHEIEQEEERVELLKQLGYRSKIIWDYEDKNKNKIKKELKEFIDKCLTKPSIIGCLMEKKILQFQDHN